MIELKEEAVDEAMKALIGLRLGDAVDGVAMAAAHLVSLRRHAREEEARELLREQAFLEEIGSEEMIEDRTSASFVRAHPREEPAECPRGPIPLGPPSTRHDAATQTGHPELPEDPTWDEVECLLAQARALDVNAAERRGPAFEALDRYRAFHPEPNPVVDAWRRRVELKRGELDHLSEWLAERRERLQQERIEAERAARAHAQAELEEARRRRLEEERTILAARARSEEARLAEERAAIELGVAHERGNAPNPPGIGRLRRCPVCNWPGVRESRKCPRAATHPPKPEGYPQA